MNLKKQVCTFKQAVKLKELGVSQNSLFHWDDGTVWNKKELRLSEIEIGLRGLTGIFSAYTVAELGAMLPNHHNVQRYLGENEAEKRADYLLYLLCEGVTTITEVNERLSS